MGMGNKLFSGRSLVSFKLIINQLLAYFVIINSILCLAWNFNYGTMKGDLLIYGELNVLFIV